MKVLILGSTGFVGRNIAETLPEDLTVIRALRTRAKASGADVLYFDLFDKSSWDNILSVSPDIIVNAAAYGVVKLETENDVMYKTNYLLTSELFDHLYTKGCIAYWLQLGTAFEYDLGAGAITEESPCLPRTHYGISKLMMSNYLLAKGQNGRFSIIRPFGMFGKYEDHSKFFPYLIQAQKMGTPVNLSPGTQKRDYIYVKDLARFIGELISSNEFRALPPVLNLGCGKAISFREYASVLQSAFPSFKPDLWNWGKLDFRPDESPLFYSASALAARYGFVNRPLQDAFRETIDYYLTKE